MALGELSEPSEPNRSKWRQRPPTLAEALAHAAAHGSLPRGRGRWLVRDGSELYLIGMIINPNALLACLMDGSNATRIAGAFWRPLTASGDDCDWPVVDGAP